MIAPEVACEVRRLLAEGCWSQRQIARTTGVSRGTVAAIALGKRTHCGPREERFAPPSGPWKRCPGCGGLVQMPCLLCQVRALRRI